MQKLKTITKLFYLTGLAFAINSNVYSSVYLFKPSTNFKIQNMISKSSADTGINENKISTDTPIVISSAFSFTEGPAVDRKGNIFFTDQPNNKIWEYDINGKLSLFMDNAGRSNGMYFDEKGNLISCADEHNQLWQISHEKKLLCSLIILTERYLTGQMMCG